jgi:DNA replication protein DnaC
VLKRLDEFRFDDNPQVPQATIAALAEGSWIDDREQVILIGDSGTGKSLCESAARRRSGRERLAPAMADLTRKTH